MLYTVGDKFVVDGILTEVRFINHGKAWVAPVEDDVDAGLVKGLVISILDEKGKTTGGKKAIPVVNETCLAV